MTVWNMPVRFEGTPEEKQANYESHAWIMEDPEEPLVCMECDSKTWHAAAQYPCGAEVPRHDVLVDHSKLKASLN